MNATAMCKAGGKEWKAYWRTDKSKEDVEAVSRSVKIPPDLLIQSITKGKNELREIQPEGKKDEDLRS